MLDEAHCVLGVHFISIMAHELTRLLQNVHSLFSGKRHSHSSVKSMQSSIQNLPVTVGHQMLDVTHQLQHTRLSIQVVIGHQTLDVAQ